MSAGPTVRSNVWCPVLMSVGREESSGAPWRGQWVLKRPALWCGFGSHPFYGEVLQPAVDSVTYPGSCRDFSFVFNSA